MHFGQQEGRDEREYLEVGYRGPRESCGFYFLGIFMSYRESISKRREVEDIGEIV